MGKTTAVAKTDEKNKVVAPANYDYGAESGAGFEGVTSDQLSIPFLNLLQNNSPSVEEEVHKAGDILNSVTAEVYPGKDGLVFQPCHVVHQYMEWKPRDAGGGLVASHAPDSDFVKSTIKQSGKQFGKLITPSGNELIDTQYVYGNILNEAGDDILNFAVIAFSSTKLTPFRKWLTAMFMIKAKPPMFAFRARIKSVKEKNAAGQPYFNIDISPLGSSWVESLISPSDDVGRVLLEQGKSLATMVKEGRAKAATDTLTNEGGVEGGSRGGAAEGEAAPF